MKLKQKNTRPKKKIYILIAVFVLVALSAYLLVKQQSSNSNNPYSNTKDVDIYTDPGQSENKDESNASSNKPADEIPSSNTGTISIVSLEQSNGYVNAQAQVTDFEPQQCVYSFAIAEGKPVVREQSGSCSSVSIPQGEFDRIGVYTLTVTAYSGDAKLSISKEIDVQ